MDPSTRYANICCGVHTGFPICCIKFYVNEWCNYSSLQRRDYILLSHFKYQDQHGGDDPCSPQYIPCPKCMENGITPVKLKKCSCYYKMMRDRPT